MRSAQAHNTETDAFEKRLRAYTVGAGAVAAGLLAFSPPAEAEIVVTQAHVTLGMGDRGPIPINIEGTTEFTLATYGSHCNIFTNSLGLAAASGAAVVVHGHTSQVAALKFGAPIGTGDQFDHGPENLVFVYVGRFATGFSTGPFANVTDRFLGLKFELNGQVHYGWAGFSKVTANFERCSITATLTAYAYETEPNTSIYAGQSSDSPRASRLLPASGSAPNAARLQPATLGVLALGSLGLDVWRKRETGAQESSGGRTS